jgi:succinate dehydrogenase / fumarate reductase cytochrome b subunit
MSGIVVLAFIVYHLAHFTLGLTHPDHKAMVDALGRPDVYSMVVLGFQQPIVALSYIVAMTLLWFHLNHGASSLFKSLGLRHPKYNTMLDKVGPAVATLVVGGNIAMPLAILAGIIGADVGGN